MFQLLSEFWGSGQIIVAAFLLIAALELIRPWREVRAFGSARWFSNLALWLIAVGLEYLIAPVVAITAARLTNDSFSWWGQVVIGVPALDALSYAIHRVLHSNRFLWELHALHHSDPELDVTTTVRHHPGETFAVAISIGIGGAILGLSPSVVALFAALNLCVQFVAHANIQLPETVSKILASLVVTPEIHRIHHSRYAGDFGTNFGAVFIFWDRLFGTYRKQPELGPNHLELGIDHFRNPEFQRLDRMIMLPVLMLRKRTVDGPNRSRS